MSIICLKLSKKVQITDKMYRLDLTEGHTHTHRTSVKTGKCIFLKLQDLIILLRHICILFALNDKSVYEKPLALLGTGK